jgi:3-hydroxyacyl-[acyl-carrier-protein] dehydratase
VRNLNITEILKILPQKFPFVFIDRVVEIDPGKKIVAIKNVTGNEAYLQGHFPSNPIFPGVLLIEAMAQASIILYYSAYMDELDTTPNYYLGSVKAQFKHPVIPGDRVSIEVCSDKLIKTGGVVSAKALVENVIVASSELIFAVKKL